MLNRPWAKALTAIVLAVSITAVAGCGTASSKNTTTNGTTATIPPAPKYSGPTVATYTGGKLTKQELDEQYNLQVVLPGQASQESKSQFVDYYVVWYKYLYQEAQQTVKTKPTAKQASQMATQAMTQLAQSSTYGTPQKLDAKMKQLGITKGDMVRYFAHYSLLQSYLQQQVQSVKVSDADAQKYYNQHKSDYIEVTVDQILLSSKSKAQSIEKQLKAGAKFSTLADKYSKDTSVKQNHGHLANTLVSQYVSQFAKACKTLPIGQWSDPVHTQYGYHVLRVDARKQLTFSQAKSQVEQTMTPQAQQKQEVKIYQNAVKAAKVKVTVKKDAL